MDTPDHEDLKRTVLHGLHLELGAKMVPFAGYDMPVQYPAGVMTEHLHTRQHAGLFDVSHMGQVILRGDGAAAALERLVPQAVQGLKTGRQRYGFFTNDQGGLLDDLMIASQEGWLLVVVNAACKDADIAHMRANLTDVEIVHVTDRALIAIQGPEAVAALEKVAPGVADMAFMDHRILSSAHGELWVSRSGYTGEDGCEVSVPADQAEAFARALLAIEGVMPIGLGARDSLRLEAGLCLYGSDIGPDTSPAEADLGWAIQKSRKSGDRAGGFPGADTVLAELENGAARKRVGLLPEGRAPMRAGTQLFETAEADSPIGSVTSGAFGPSIGRPVSMGYVTMPLSAVGTRLFGEVRGKRLPVIVSPMPFHPHAYHRKN